MLKKILTSRESEDNKLSSVLEVTIEAIEEVLAAIKKLDPYPARQFASSKQISYVVPDVVIRKSTEDEILDGKDNFIVEMLKGALPEIALSEEFEKMANMSKEANQFVGDSVKNASWFINAVRQRGVTVYKVSGAILKHQHSFFANGPIMQGN